MQSDQGDVWFFVILARSDRLGMHLISCRILSHNSPSTAQAHIAATPTPSMLIDFERHPRALVQRWYSTDCYIEVALWACSPTHPTSFSPRCLDSSWCPRPLRTCPTRRHSTASTKRLSMWPWRCSRHLGPTDHVHPQCILIISACEFPSTYTLVIACR